MNGPHSVRAGRYALVGLTALLAGACAPAAALTPAPRFDGQACAEEAAPGHRVELLTMACARGDEEGCARLARRPPPPGSGPSPVVVGSREP